MCVDRRNLKGSRHGTTALGQGSSAPVTGVVWSADGSRRATLVSTNESRRRESPAGAREPSAPEAALVRRLPPSHHSETKRVDSPVDCPRVGPGSNSVCRQGIRSSSGPQREVGPRVRPGTHGSKSTPLLYQCFLQRPSAALRFGVVSVVAPARLVELLCQSPEAQPSSTKWRPIAPLHCIVTNTNTMAPWLRPTFHTTVIVTVTWSVSA